MFNVPGLNRFLKQESSGRVNESTVPDLDDMGGGGNNHTESEGHQKDLASEGTGERVYGLNEDEDIYK